MADILIVDDDEIIRQTLCELLGEKYSCQTARTAEEAFAKLASKTFDLVLTDVSMPDGNGVELLSGVLQKYPKIPVIVISGLGDQEHAQGLIKLGAFDFLLKPFRLEVVEKSVSRALEYRRKLTEVNDESEETPESGGWKIVDSE